MLPCAHVLVEIAARTAVIYGIVLIGVRISGKREVGQMTPFDLTLLLLISNAVQNAMTGPDTSLIGGVIAASTLLILNYVVAELSGANRRFRKFVQGQPRSEERRVGKECRCRWWWSHLQKNGKRE